MPKLKTNGGLMKKSRHLKIMSMLSFNNPYNLWSVWRRIGVLNSMFWREWDEDLHIPHHHQNKLWGLGFWNSFLLVAWSFQKYKWYLICFLEDKAICIWWNGQQKSHNIKNYQGCDRRKSPNIIINKFKGFRAYKRRCTKGKSITFIT